MKKILYILLLTLLFACKQDSPYWKIASLGLINSLAEDNILMIENCNIGYFKVFERVSFFVHGNSLSVLCERLREYYLPEIDEHDTVLLWRNRPIDISNSKLILNKYKIFEQEFRAWNDTTNNCSDTNIFNIYFNHDTLVKIDRGCNFNSFFALVAAIQENVDSDNIYSISNEQADSIINLKRGLMSIENP